MKPVVIESTSSTSSTFVTNVAKDFLGGESSGGDILLRVKLDNEFKTFNVASTNTQTVRDGLNEYFIQHRQDVELLCSVIYWQKRTIDYQALHTAFLLNSLSEDEFEEEAEKFTIYQKNVHPKKIASVIERLDSLIAIKFDTSDYADYFQCNQQEVMAGLNLLPYAHFAAKLPTVSEE